MLLGADRRGALQPPDVDLVLRKDLVLLDLDLLDAFDPVAGATKQAQGALGASGGGEAATAGGSGSIRRRRSP